MGENASEDDIRALSGIEAARLMPGIYIGGTDQRALHTVVWNLIGHAIHESLSRPGNQIAVTIEPGNIVRVTDDGLGLPVTLDKWTERPLVERALSTAWVGSQWPGQKREVSNRHHQAYYVGLFAAVAVAEYFTAEVKQHGYLWRIIYHRGERYTDLERIRELTNPTETGTTIIFQPDYTIFQSVEVDHQYMYHSLRELSFLMSPLAVNFEDKRPSALHPPTIFRHPEGTADFVRFLNREFSSLHEPIIIRKLDSVKLSSGSDAVLEIDIAVQYTASQQTIILSYTNGIENEEGGVHVQGLINGWCTGINAVHYHANSLKVWPFITEDEALGGMVAVISIWYSSPTFEGASKRKLNNPEIQMAVEKSVSHYLSELADTLDNPLAVIIGKCLENRAERLYRRYGD